MDAVSSSSQLLTALEAVQVSCSHETEPSMLVLLKFFKIF
jgi:hypothetical protein